MLVGRDDILVNARGGLASARDGNGAALLLCGEPGIGKTRVAQEVARDAVADGFKVLWASCWDGGGSPALWPWVQILRGYAASTDASHVEEVAGTDAADLARIVPGFAGREAPASAPDPDTDGEDRFHLFDAVATFLERAASAQPLCLVVDDVQWADQSSLELVRFLGSQMAASPLFLLAARRTNEPEPGPSTAVLDQLVASTPTMELHGLTPVEVATVFESVTGVVPGDELVAAVHERSGGNPLFVRELARLLRAQDQVGPDRTAELPSMPAAVQSVISHRLGMLSEDCRSVLESAAVLGMDFDANLAEWVAHRGAQDAPTAAVAEAVEAGVVLGPAPPATSHRFAHGIVRDVLYASIEGPTRADLHRAAARKIEQAALSNPDELLDHYERAGTPDDLARALDHAESAADQALGRLAFDEAAEVARHGLTIADRVGSGDDRRLTLLLRCGHALNRSGEIESARSVFLEAADVARRDGSSAGLADAALGYGYIPQHESLGGTASDPKLRSLLEEVLPDWPRDTVRGIVLRWRLGTELLYVEPDTVQRLAAEAMDGARRVDDPRAVGRALELKGQTLFSEDDLVERLDLVTELYELGRSTGLADIEMRGRVWRVVTLMELGDFAAVDREIAASERLIDDARLRAERWYPALWRSMRALHDGRLADAEDLANDAVVAGEAQGQGAIDHLGMQLMAIRREQGRMDELIDLIQDSAERYPEIPGYRCALAMACAESGQLARSRAQLDALAADRFALIAHDYNWSASMMCLSIACVLLDDADHASTLLELWSESEECFVFVGYGAVSGGAVGFHIGALAATAGRSDAAIAHLEAALVRNRQAGATLWAVRTETVLGRLLRDRDPDRAAALLARARATATELGLTAATADLDAIADPEPLDAETGDSAADDAFRRDGEMWTLTFESRTAHVRDAKGMRDLAQMLRSPGQEIHALQLYAEGGPVPPPAAADDPIDERAAREYRARIRDLQEEIDDAEVMHDTGRAERARIELDTLTETLAAAYGLGGRPRKGPADPAERARKAVSARVRDSIKRISAAHPGLGTHLDRSVNTGTFLSYTPDREIHWKV